MKLLRRSMLLMPATSASMPKQPRARPVRLVRIGLHGNQRDEVWKKLLMVGTVDKDTFFKIYIIDLRSSWWILKITTLFVSVFFTFSLLVLITGLFAPVVERKTQSLVLLEDECRLQEARGLDCNQQKSTGEWEVLIDLGNFFGKGGPVDHDMKCIFKLRGIFRILFDGGKSSQTSRGF